MSQGGKKHRTYNKTKEGQLVWLHRIAVKKHITEGKIEGRIEVAERRGKRRRQLLCDLKGNERVLKIERGSARSHSVENWLWKTLWT